MLYIYNQTILVEIKELNNGTYLIGETIYPIIAQSILNNAFNSVDWNRALKFQTINHDQIHKLGHFSIKLDIYYDYVKQKIVYLTKNQFHQKVLNQTYFDQNFAPYLFAFRNRNKKGYLPKILPSDFFVNHDIEALNQLELDTNRVFVNDDFDLSKFKYKVLFKMGQTFRVESTKLAQTIYTIDYQNPLITAIDSKTNKVYLQGSFAFNHFLNLDLVYEDKQLVDQLLNSLIQWIEQTIDLKYRAWHLFNVTRNYQYLEDEIAQLCQDLNYDQVLNYLNRLFNEIQLNFASIIFKSQSIKNSLASVTQTKQQKKDLEIQIKRYSVLTPIDLKNLADH